MVLSRLNDTVSYPELKKVDREDRKTEAITYQTELQDVDVMIALGKPKHTFADQDIVYFPIYLVCADGTAVQVGVYETKTRVDNQDYTRFFGQDGSVDIAAIGLPLMYSFATKKYLLDRRLVPEVPLRKPVQVDKEEVVGEKEEEPYYEYYSSLPQERRDVFSLTKVALPPLLKEETKKKARDIRNKYKESKEDNWIRKHMQNKYYEILDNEGGGDCLFAVIRDAFGSIGQHTTVAKLRAKLAADITDEDFSHFFTIYENLKQADASERTHIKNLEQEYAAIKEQFLISQDREEKKRLGKRGEEIRKEHERYKEERKASVAIFSKFKFMKNLDDIVKFKEHVKKCDFWANPWALQTLEKLLNIKLIVLSLESFTQKDLCNVLQCGAIPKEVQTKGKFQPEFYILVELKGDEYRLVSYKGKKIFKFTEIPYDLKKRMAEKCMETNGGLFELIPDLQQFQKTLQSPSSESDSESTKGLSIQPSAYEDMLDSKIRGLYDDDVVLQFYSKSKDRPVPGQGDGEKIPDDRLLEFRSLAAIPQWRKKLSNFWVQPFSLDNHQWSSVEHYYQASKFKDTSPQFYLSFSLDANNELSKDPLMAKGAGGKTGKHKGEQIRPTQVVEDSDFFGKKSKKAMYDALYAKFSQHPDLKSLLLATNKAKLTNFMRGGEPVVSDDMMLVREKLYKQNQLA